MNTRFRRHRHRAVAAIAVVGTSVLGLVGCSSQVTEQPVAPDSVDLKVAVWTTNPDQLALLKQIGDAFADENKDVRSVTFEPAPQGSDYLSVLTTELSGGNPPDAGWLTEGTSKQFSSQGALYDLSSVLKNTEGYDFGDLVASSMATWVDGDKVYGVPFSTSPIVMFYNEDMFTAAGQPTPAQMQASGNWTWSKVADVAKKIHDAEDKPGVTIGSFKFDNAWNQLAAIFYGYDAEPWNASGAECEFDSDNMVKAMSLINQMIADGGFPQPGQTVDFPSGGVAMTTAYISQANGLKNAAYKWGVAPLPAGPDGHVSVIGQSAFTVFSKSAHPAQAAQLVAYLTSKGSQEKLAAYWPSIRQSLLNSDTLASANPVLSAQQINDVVVPALQDGKVLPVHANNGKISPQVRAGLEPIWKPGADVRGTLKDLCTEIDPLLTQG